MNLSRGDYGTIGGGGGLLGREEVDGLHMCEPQIFLFVDFLLS